VGILSGDFYENVLLAGQNLHLIHDKTNTHVFDFANEEDGVL
jgi:hypothetical protein